MPKMERPGIILTIIGVGGIFVSFVIQRGELDPSALGLSFASIFLAVCGIAWILGSPGVGSKQAIKTKRRHKRK